MRAYGDRDLFKRYKSRFIVAPILLLAICIPAMMANLQAVVLVAAVWGIWHALMQTYGFLRIYDAKVASFANATRRLDLAMCLSWFAAAVLFSDNRMAMLLDFYYQSGGMLLPSATVYSARILCGLTAATVTTLFAVNLVRAWRIGSPPNPVKLILMLTSFSFYWYTNVAVVNILVGLAMFEIFHDVQYLAIVWLFNRNKVEKDKTVVGFTRFIFRRSGALLGVYLGLIFAYGGLRYVEHGLTSGAFRSLMTGLLATSGLMHFYFDGFIWKVRESSTAKSLGIKCGQKKKIQVPGLVHSLKWGLFILPVGLLTLAQQKTAPSELERLECLAASLPSHCETHHSLGFTLHENGMIDQAIHHYRIALQQRPEFVDAHVNLATALRDTRQNEEALEHFNEAIRLDPVCVTAHNNMGNLLAEDGLYSDAEHPLRLAIKYAPQSLESHNNLGRVLARQGRLMSAESQFRKSLDIDPNHVIANYNLGNVLVEQGNLAEASLYFRRALAINPAFTDARRKLQQVHHVQRNRG